jgi:hypothetical protein
MNFIMLRPDQSPFHDARPLITSSWLKSGIQNPVLNSLFSTSVRCSKASSRLLGGRPFLRSLCNCSISGTLRLIYLAKQMLACDCARKSNGTGHTERPNPSCRLLRTV